MARINRALWLVGIVLACAGKNDGRSVINSENGTAEHCISDSEGLRTALLTAAANGQHDTVRLVQGNYSGSFAYDSTEAFDLTIEGGYTANCASRVVDPANTVIDSSVGLRTDQVAKLVIEGLTVQKAGGMTTQTAGEVVLSRNVLNNNTRGAYITAASATIRDSTIENNTNPSYAAGLFIIASTVTLTGNQVRNNEVSGYYALSSGGIEIQCPVDWDSCDGTVTLSNNVIENNSCWGAAGGFAGAVQLSHDEVLFQNNLIVGNSAYTNGGVTVSGKQVTFINNVIASNWTEGGTVNDVSASTNIYIINNTIAGNGAIALLVGGGRIDIYNNIFFENWSWFTCDLAVYGGDVYLFNNDFDHSTAGVPWPIHPSNLNNVDPLFASGSLRPRPGSPVINKGLNTAPRLPVKDVDGNPRIYGGRVDMGAYEVGSTWLPGAPRSPSPANGVAGAPLEPTLTWTKGARATSHDVYFGRSLPPPLVRNTSAASFKPGTLAADKTYYWRVVAKNSFGTATSPMWSFKTGNLGARNPSPHNGASGVSLNPTLVWTAGLGATSYDIYFGVTSPPPKVGNVGGTSYLPGVLSPYKTYYWKVVTRMGSNSLSSPVWSFKTK